MGDEAGQSGEIEWLRAAVARLEDQLGEHKRVAQDLAASTARTNAILDVAVDGILTIDESGTIETVNTAVGRMFGYKPHELIGRNVKLLMPSPFFEEHDGYLASYRRTGQRRIIGIGREVEGLHRGGGIFPLELSVSEGFDGTRRFFAGTVRDLSEREEAREAQASLASILEESLNEIYVFSADSLRFIQVNRGARENLGYTIEELSELTPLDIKPELDPKAFQELLGPLEAGERSRQHFETVHERRDGSTYPVEVDLQLGTYAGSPAFVAIIFDLTERNRVRGELVRSETRAREAEQLASIATLTAGIAHDIGTPMNIILGYAQMLQRSVQDPKDRERVDIIADQVNRVSDLVQTLLGMARPQNEVHGPVDLDGVIAHALDFYQEKLRKHGITVERSLAAAASVEGDPSRLEQVFLNLFVNALDAMPDGGTLTVTSSSTEDAVVASVSDSGIGIAPDLQQQVFDPFVTTKERGQGTGLGLVVTKSIVVDHDGEIRFESAPGQGTTFRLTFPLAGS